MSMSESILGKHQLIIFMVAAMAIAGIPSYIKIPRAEDPGFIIRNAVVITHMTGASPEMIEMMITDKLEKKIQEISELEYIKSESRYEISIIKIKILDKYTDVRAIWDSLRRKVSDIREQLPKEASDPIINDEFGDVFGIIYGLSVPPELGYRYVNEIAKTLRKRLLMIDKVAKVNIEGNQEECVFIEYDSSKMAAVGVSAPQLHQFLSVRNIIDSGGLIRTDREAIAVETSGNFTSIDDIAQMTIPITSAGGVPSLVKLQHIADIKRGYQDPPVYKIGFNGEPNIILTVSMTSDGNIVALEDIVDKAMSDFMREIPIGIEINRIWSQGSVVKKIVDDFTGTLFEAMIIIFCVLLVFLGFRVGLIVAAMIPIIISITILIMKNNHWSLNQISLAALIVSLGMLVDTSVVIAESIIIKVSKGDIKKNAILKSVQDLSFPLCISTLIICSAFLPIYLSPSQIGEYTSQLFTVIASALAVSWVCSITFVPAIFAFVLPDKAEHKEADKRSKLQDIYNRILILFLVHKYRVLIMIAVVVCIGIFSLSTTRKMFLPKSDLPYFTVEITLPYSAPFNWLENQIGEIETFIKDEMMVKKDGRPEGVVGWVSYMGNGGPRYRLVHDPEIASINYGFMMVKVNNEGKMDSIIEQLDKFIYNHYPDVKIKLRRLELGVPIKHPIEIRINGDDLTIIKRIVEQVKHKLETIRGTRDVADDMGLPSKRLYVNVGDVDAIRSGLNNHEIAVSLSSLFSGVPISVYREDDKLIPIVMRSNVAHAEAPVFDTSHILFPSKGNGTSPLSSVASVELTWSPSIVLRYDRFRYGQAVSNTLPGFTANEITSEIEPWLINESKNWPAGYSWNFEGEYKASQTASQALASKLHVAVFGVMALLLLYFNCVRRTLIVLLIFPLSLIGAAAGLLIANSYFGFMTMIGIIALGGIVFSNAIVLVDSINYEMYTNKRSPQDAIVIATHSRTRPILLTATSTILGMLPMFLADNVLFEPLTVVIIFGLVVGTFLTLLIVPVLFASFFNIEYSANYINSNDQRAKT